MSAADRRLARALALFTGAAMAATQAGVGFTRDEGYYFTAARLIEEWLALLLRAPLQAISAAGTERFWGYNSEHPGLTKLLFALSHYLFTTRLHWLPDTLAWRLPAFAFAGLLTLWLAELGFARSRAAGVLAPLLFWCAERTFFHGHLACFDLPICALTAGVGVAWARALGILDRKNGGFRLPASGFRPREIGPGLWLAWVYGCALAVKHNAWFLPPVLLAHALLCPAPLRARALRQLAWLCLSPLVLFAAWPLLWHAPLTHLRAWIEFHLHHVHYAWWYLGDLYREPPFPIEYPLALDALVLPVTTVALLGASGVTLLARTARRIISPLQLLELGLAGAGALPFLLRTTPIFGGIKHWLVLPALLAPEAAALLVRACDAAAEAFAELRVSLLASRSRTLALGAFCALAPGLVQIARVHPYGTSAYGELAGDIPGAASLGLQRQYWSGNVTSVLPWLNEHAPPGARVYFHEVNFESYRAYQLAGMLRPDLQYAAGPEWAEYAVLQWHREFRDIEPHTWNAFGTRRPATGLYLDEVPQIVVYARPGMPGGR